MGISKSEKGVVKLVHPGRHVEILTQPITAAEVMSKNPRHCIARPDVFQYPWIVIRPESVLEPGGVFYVVPYRTISDLLKAKKHGDSAQPCTKQNNSQMESHPYFRRCTPFHQQHDRCLINPFKAAQVNSWPMAIYMKRSDINIQQEADRKIHERFRVSESTKIENGNRKTKSRERVMELKSCMRKEASVRKTQNLKVSFALTTRSRIEAESPIQCVGCTG